jgi:hypothetical protein
MCLELGMCPSDCDPLTVEWFAHPFTANNCFRPAKFVDSLAALEPDSDRGEPVRVSKAHADPAAGDPRPCGGSGGAVPQGSGSDSKSLDDERSAASDSDSDCDSQFDELHKESVDGPPLQVPSNSTACLAQASLGKAAGQLLDTCSDTGRTHIETVLRDENSRHATKMKDCGKAWKLSKDRLSRVQQPKAEEAEGSKAQQLICLR